MSQGPENDASKPKASPCYFIVRTTGEVVPLIAVDELPPGIDIVGVPRSLDLEGTIGMLNLGLQCSSGSFYQIYRTKDKSHSINGSAVISKVSGQAAQSTPRPEELHQHSVSQYNRGGATNTNMPPSSPSSSQPQRALPRLEPQVCRHWCAYGICKWGQQCRFHHIMPMTLSGLRSVGLPDWPAWYRALNPGYFAGQVNKRRAKAGLRGATQANACPKPVQKERVDAPEDIGGHQTMARLRNMQLGSNGRADQAKNESVSKNIMLERASVKDTKDWEDDGDSDSEPEVVGKKGGAMKEKLVDV